MAFISAWHTTGVGEGAESSSTQKLLAQDYYWLTYHNCVYLLPEQPYPKLSPRVGHRHGTQWAFHCIQWRQSGGAHSQRKPQPIVGLLLIIVHTCIYGQVGKNYNYASRFTTMYFPILEVDGNYWTFMVSFIFPILLRVCIITCRHSTMLHYNSHCNSP